MLTDRFTDNINLHMISFEEYRPYPDITERKKWESLETTIKEFYITAADEFIDYEFQPITACTYLYTGRTDDLSVYNKLRRENLDALNALAIAECIQNTGKYMGKIIDGVWSILDEATWHLPCPTAMYPRFPAVMVDVTDPLIELGASSYTHTLAVIYYLLKVRFDEIDENIFKRLYSEIDRKILTPYLEREDYWWMAFERHYHKKMGVLYSINNFTTHCTNYVLETFLMLERNESRRSRAIEKTMEILDNYIDYVADDGWCDEGNGYWFMSYGALNLVLEKIAVATNDYVNVFDEEKIYNMGQYLCRSHIGNGYFVNFADSHPINHLISNKVIRFAQNTKNDKLMKMAFSIAQGDDFLDIITKRIVGLETSLFVMFNLGEIREKYGVNPKDSDYIENEYYYPDSEVLVVRENEKTYQGIFMACKAGHNDENHNHNDVGNFIVYKDGRPVLVDPGVESYIADTFNKNRYKLWTMQSRYHNLPTFNGVMQKETRIYKARDVKYITNVEISGMFMNLKNVYEREAGLVKYERTIMFNRNLKKVECIDDIELTQHTDDIEFSFMTPCNTGIAEGEIRFYENEMKIATMKFDHTILNYDEEIIIFRDRKLEEEWNGSLKRIILRVKKPVRILKVSFELI